MTTNHFTSPVSTPPASPPLYPLPLEVRSSRKMHLRKPWQKKMELLSFTFLLEPFHLLSITTLTLLLPLSFLLLSRLSTPNFLNTQPSFILSTNPSLLHLLISIITILSLFHTLSGRAHLGPKASWALLCSVQVCVVMGLQASIHRPDGPGFVFGPGSGLGLFSRAVFLVGLHETMMCWSKIVVRPVVDEAVWGREREERWVERVVMTVACGALWWLRLRVEVEALVAAVEVGDGVGEFLGWWLYYLNVSIGIARVLKGAFWVGMVVFYKRFEDVINGVGFGFDQLDEGVEEQV